MDGTMMSQYEPKPAKKIYIYRNGVVNTEPKLVIVNERQIRDFTTLLGRVTSSLKAPIAVRNIYTPSGGQRINNIGELKNGAYYVAGGGEQFKKISYHRTLLPRRPGKAELGTRTQQSITASPRYRKPIEKPLVIHVFRNGDECFKGARVLLPRTIMTVWDLVLETITEKLCTLDGKLVHSVGELQDGGRYVALEGSKSFKKVAYSSMEDTPLHRRRVHGPRIKLPSLSHPPLELQPHPPNESQGPHPRRRIKLRPMAGRKNKEAREKAVRDIQEDRSFGGSPTHNDGSFTQQSDPHRSPTPTSPETVLTHKENTRSYNPGTPPSEEDATDLLLQREKWNLDPERNKGKDITSEVIHKHADIETVQESIHKHADIETVQESGDIDVERPIDQEEPEEVVEEGPTTFYSSEHEPSQHRQDVEMVAKPQQTHVDLSVNRMVSMEHTEHLQQPPVEESRSEADSQVEDDDTNHTHAAHSLSEDQVD